MKHQKEIEAYFVALGLRFIRYPNHALNHWVDKQGIHVLYENESNIIESNSAFIKWVMERMEGESADNWICRQTRGKLDEEWFSLFTFSVSRFDKAGVLTGFEFYEEEIKSNNIPLAAVRAATRYFKSKEK